VLVGQRPWHTALNPDGATIYSANGESNDITAVDVASLRPFKSVPVGRLPWGLAIRP
jgi:YVTN family beta-propeller protein